MKVAMACLERGAWCSKTGCAVSAQGSPCCQPPRGALQEKQGGAGSNGGDRLLITAFSTE